MGDKQVPYGSKKVCLLLPEETTRWTIQSPLLEMHPSCPRGEKRPLMRPQPAPRESLLNDDLVR